MGKVSMIMLSIVLNLFYLHSGDVLPGSVPGSVVYQGRIEKNNAPLNGIVHIKFRIYGSPEGSDLLWDSDYKTTEARAGVFSVTLTPPIEIFSQGAQRYIEVEVEGEKLTPREPINSVIYSMIAKRLEDGSYVHFSSAIVGTILPSYPSYSGQKLIVYGGGIYTDQICFYPYGQCMSSPGEASVASTLFSSGTVRIRADIDNDQLGDIIFETRGTNEVARILNNGNVGIGTSNPTEKLDVDGNIRITGNMNVLNDINYGGILNNGLIRGKNSEQISIGVVNDRIDFLINNSTMVSINGTNVGIGTTNPSYNLDVVGSIAAQTLYISTIILTNEIKNPAGHINLQASTIHNVGIGTDTPTEKLHVAGVVRADRGIHTTSATFTSDVDILGNLKVTRYGKRVELSSTTVYGRLDVLGELFVNQDKIAALASTQTFSGTNTFSSKTYFSSHAFVSNGIMVYGANTYAFGEGKYLQVGNPLSTNDNAVLYLAAGSNASAYLNFYNGLNKTGSISASSNILKITHSNSDNGLYLYPSLISIYGPSIALSTFPTATPAIYINSQGNVGIATTTVDEKLVVNGSIRLSGSGSGIKFNDGSILTSAGVGSAGNLSNNGDVIIYADADNNGSGAILLKTNNTTAMIVTNNAKVGLGTLNPKEKLQIIGDVMIGDTLNPYAGDSKSDLIVEGNLVVDGYFKQRSSLPAEFESLYVAGDVFLSTKTTSKTGIGTTNPLYKLDVSGDINLTGDLKVGGTSVLTSAKSLTNLTGINSSGDIIFSSLNSSRLVATDASKRLISNISADNLRSSVSGTTGTGYLVFSTNPVFTIGITVDGWGNFQQGITASSGTFTQSGDYSIVTSSGIYIGAGSVYIGGLTASRLVATDASKRLISNISADNLRSSVNGTTGTGYLVFSTNPVFTIGITVDGWGNFQQGITASSGTFTQSGDYSIKTSSGINILAGIVNLNNSARIKNAPDPEDDQDVATKGYVDQYLGGGGGGPSAAWVVTGNSLLATGRLGSITPQNVEFIRNNSTQFSMLANGVNFYVPILSNYSITASSGTFGAQGIYSPIIKFANNVYISSTTTNYGGIYISTHIYLRSGAIYYGDGSGLTNIDANKITSGTLPATRGGTGLSGAGGIANRVLVTTDGNSWTAGQVSPATMIGPGTLPNNVIASSIAVNTVHTAAIQNGAVTDAKIAAGISPSKLAAGSLPSNVIASSIAVNAVYTAAIQDNAVTNAKVAGIDASKITSGTLPVGKGGTGNTTFTSNKPIIYDGTNLKLVSFPNSVFTGSFTIAKSTNPEQGCMQLNFQYGILVSTATVSCP